ncbi:hypothetical protein SEUCBS140593_010104 [Sporothrix eucalyptigena]|uniref:Uncharacterized protein n=1 Tax=Sporothrix eucalyptigena TaxID=1812306 RepID=A0ABP0D1U5_9PEZI
MQTILRPTTPPDAQWLWVALDGHPIRLDFYTTCTEGILQLSVQYVAVIALAARQAVVCADVAMDMAEQVVQPVSVFAKLRLMMRKRTLQDLVHNMDSTLQATRAIHTEWDALRDIQIDSLEYSPMRLRESVRVHLENTEMLLVQTSHAAGSAANAEIPEEILLREARVLRTAMACVHEACTLVVIANNLRQAMGSAIVCSISGDFELFDKLSPPEVKPLDEKKMFLTRGGDGSVDNSFVSRIDQIYRRCQVAEANAGAAVRSGMDLPVP